jgi:hypothetical protein
VPWFFDSCKCRVTCQRGETCEQASITQELIIQAYRADTCTRFAVEHLHKNVDHITSSVLNMPSSSAKAACVCSKHAAASRLAPMQLACCFACEIADFETRSAFMLIGAVKQLHGRALNSSATTTAQSNVMMLCMS